MAVQASTVKTARQQMAVRAFECVRARHAAGKDKAAKVKFEDYVSFARGFPTLIHTSGLCQALAFALPKNERRAVAEDVAKVLATTLETLDRESREADVVTYIRRTERAIEAAVWIKRYAEGLNAQSKDGKEGGPS